MAIVQTEQPVMHAWHMFSVLQKYPPTQGLLESHMLFSLVPRHFDPEQASFSSSGFDPQYMLSLQVLPMGTASTCQQMSNAMKTLIDRRWLGSFGAAFIILKAHERSKSMSVPYSGTYPHFTGSTFFGLGKSEIARVVLCWDRPCGSIGDVRASEQSSYPGCLPVVRLIDVLVICPPLAHPTPSMLAR